MTDKKDIFYYAKYFGIPIYFQPEEQIEKCRLCCWYYTSSFEMEVDDNSCATCRHKEKMLTDKKPCKDCDNGCNWEK